MHGAAAPWTCRFTTTTVSDGLYDLRAIAADAAGNTEEDRDPLQTPGRQHDRQHVSLEDPGAFLRGTVTLPANANALGGVASVRIQRSKAGATTWTDVCTDTTSPYACAFDTTTAATPDGAYDLRAIMTSDLGASRPRRRSRTGRSTTRSCAAWTCRRSTRPAAPPAARRPATGSS